MKDINALMPVSTALGLAAVALQTSLEEAIFDDLRVVLRRAQDVVDRLASLPPEVLDNLDAMVRGHGAHRTVRRASHRLAARLH